MSDESAYVISGRHENAARKLLGDVYRCPIEGRPGASIGAVEVTNAQREVAAMLAESEYLRAQLARAREALESVEAGLGDRLLAKGPLSQGYAHAIMRKVQAALSPNADSWLAEKLAAAEAKGYGDALNCARAKVESLESAPPKRLPQTTGEHFVSLTDVLRALAKPSEPIP